MDVMGDSSALDMTADATTDATSDASDAEPDGLFGLEDQSGNKFQYTPVEQEYLPTYGNNKKYIDQAKKKGEYDYEGGWENLSQSRRREHWLPRGSKQTEWNYLRGRIAQNTGRRETIPTKGHPQTGHDWATTLLQVA